MIKKISFYLGLGGIICLVQSCGGVYNSANLTVDSAIESNQPLKVKTTEGTVFKISRLEKDEKGLYGIARRESNAARKHREKIRERDYQGKYVKIDLPQEDSIEEIKTKNKELSILLPIAIGAAVLASLVYAISTMAVMP